MPRRALFASDDDDDYVPPWKRKDNNHNKVREWGDAEKRRIDWRPLLTMRRVVRLGATVSKRSTCKWIEEGKEVKEDRFN